MKSENLNFFTSSQVRLMLLVLRPHLENQWFTLIRIHPRGLDSTLGKRIATSEGGCLNRTRAVSERNKEEETWVGTQ